MLSLERKPGELIQIGSDAAIIVLEVRGSCVRLGLDFPEDVRLMRSEISRERSEASRRLRKAWELYNGVFGNG